MNSKMKNNRILVIDNYDSFVYNLVHLLYKVDVNDIHIVKNDQIDFNKVGTFDKILLSPGPGIPKEAGQLLEIIEKFGHQKDVLGICLGHQAIAEFYGGELLNLKESLHGVSSLLSPQSPDVLFKNMPNEFRIGHYHSWVVKPELPNELEVLASDTSGNIMAIRHRKHRVRGLQFHPESILTEKGEVILSNWVWGDDYN
jgi:anthranilate synthase component II